MTWIAGVDGFKSKWVVVLHDLASDAFFIRVVPTITHLLNLPQKLAVVTVDIPIGLPEFTPAGGRRCEQQARRVLGPRASSVFSAVGRLALREATRLDAHIASQDAGGIGVGAQAWGLSAKLREADSVMSPEAQRVVHEVHPEVSFWAMNGEKPMAFGKKVLSGERERQDLLIRCGFPYAFIHGMGAELRVGRDDFLDACAATWTAARVLRRNAGRFPPDPDPDGRGLDQAIWF